MEPLSICNCAVTVETYHKFTLKVMSTQRRKGCTVTYSLNHSKGSANCFTDKSGNAERPLRLSVKCFMGNDVYFLNDAVILDKKTAEDDEKTEGLDGCITIQLPSYRCVLTIFKLPPKEAEQLRQYIYISYGIDTDEKKVGDSIIDKNVYGNLVDDKENTNSGKLDNKPVENVFVLASGGSGDNEIGKASTALASTPGKAPRKVSQSIAALFQKQATSSGANPAAVAPAGAAVLKSPALTPCKKKTSRGRGTPPLDSSSKSKSAPAEIKLTDTQKRVLADCAAGKSVFFTGAAGTGKSHLISILLAELLRKYDKSSVHLTALTGLAACNIGGATLHQFSGVGGFNDGDDVAAAAKQALGKLSVVRRWKAARCLVVDEVSMMTCDLLDLISLVAQKARGQPGPFGGLQVVFCGDFYQLPPVANRAVAAHAQASQCHLGSQLAVASSGGDRRFCFQSALWTQLFDCTYTLDRVFRQKGSSSFIDLLNSIRKGNCSREVVDAFGSCVGRQLDCTDGILPTKIFTHKEDVDAINSKELALLQGEEREYIAIDSGDDAFIKSLQSNCPARGRLRLRVGAQVILVKTLDIAEGLVNGSRGVVAKFTKDTKRPVVRFREGVERIIKSEVFSLSLTGRVVAQRSQLPLDLSWGISVHKSQGMSVDKAEVNLRRVFEFGQAYVALSRVRSMEGLSLAGPLLPQQIRVHADVADFYDKLEARQRRNGRASSSCKGGDALDK